MSKTLKPGQPAPKSAQYGLLGPRGGDTGKERTVTKGERLPPTPKKGMTYKVNDLTKH
ncbi:MAG: YjzC family protein [Sphingobium sp.]|nr:YjzC family protein [Sphingobium sp.]MBP9156878.1 YjzC family protein [Sphingobium sp.]